eukprot:1469022-Pleurochrysis_carterae.AAC.1
MTTRRMLGDDSARTHICTMLDAHRTGKLEAMQFTTYVMLAGMPPSKEYHFGSLATKAENRVMVVAKPSFYKFCRSVGVCRLLGRRQAHAEAQLGVCVDFLLLGVLQCAQ